MKNMLELESGFEIIVCFSVAAWIMYVSKCILAMMSW